VLIEIWSDVACPFCYVGKRHLEAALADFDHRDEVEVRWRSFQLDPSAARSTPDDPPGTARLIAAKYGMPLEQAEAMNDRVTAMAAEAGLDFHLDAARQANTLDAHRLLHEAARHGAQDALKERLLRAYFTDGERVDDSTLLTRLAVEAGVPQEATERVLGSGEHADAVQADQSEAAALGATGVPFVVVDRRYGVAGAQPVQVFTRTLEQAWAERVPVVVPAVAAPGGEVCGPEGC